MEKVRLASGVSLSTAPRLLLVIGTLDPAHTVNPVLFTILGIASFTGVTMNLRLAGMLVLSLSGQFNLYNLYFMIVYNNSVIHRLYPMSHWQCAGLKQFCTKGTLLHILDCTLGATVVPSKVFIQKAA